jgi:hypothetical protein
MRPETISFVHATNIQSSFFARYEMYMGCMSPNAKKAALFGAMRLAYDPSCLWIDVTMIFISSLMCSLVTVSFSLHDSITSTQDDLAQR